MPCRKLEAKFDSEADANNKQSSCYNQIKIHRISKEIGGSCPKRIHKNQPLKFSEFVVGVSRTYFFLEFFLLFMH